MTQTNQQSTHISEIRDLAKRFDANALEKCMQRALQNKDNPCYAADEFEDVINVLAKANFVTTQMQQGQTIAGAIRELGKRIRSIQGEQ